MAINQRITISLAFLWVLAFFLNAQVEKTGRLEIDDFQKHYTFFPDVFSGYISLKDGEHYAQQEETGSIGIYSLRSGERISTLMDGALLRSTNIPFYSDFILSPDETKILLIGSIEPIYRRSFLARYYIFDIQQKTILPLEESGKQQLATFSPDSKKIAFAKNNNLYYRDLGSGEIIQITHDGLKNNIINGVPDWVYEEEFEYNQAFVWSPDSRSIAWCRFDESEVKTFGMTIYKGMNPELKENQLYPETRVWKYPKAGENNSVVSVFVFDLQTGIKTKMDVGGNPDQYIPRIKWSADNEKLCIYRLNRLQNQLDILLADRKDGASTVVYSEVNKYYIDEAYFDALTFLQKSNDFIFISERNGWRHIWRKYADKDVLFPITSGNWDVTRLIGVDEERGIVYYQSAEVSPVCRDVYSIHLDGSGKKSLSSLRGTNDIEFTKGFRYYIHSFSNTSTPYVFSLFSQEGTLVRILEDNTRLRNLLSEYNIRWKEFFQFTTSDSVLLNGFIIKPPDFSKKKKYPVLMTQYSGPNSQSALDAWDFDWEYYLAQEGYIIVCVDGRGTGARGEEFRKQTYLQLGKLETIDQIETAKYLASLKYVDPARIGIFGWSYGGFMVCNCLTQGAGLFKVGIAVAPVTNWRYYDNIYTERFLRTPQENSKGYDDNSPLFHAGKLQGKLLLIHGTADDNVHLQNTLEFAEALVQAGKLFDMHVYTNRNHGIYGGNTRSHLYNKMVEYLILNL